MNLSLLQQLNHVPLAGLEVRVPGETADAPPVLAGIAERVTTEQVWIRLDDGSLDSADYHDVEVVDMDAYKARSAGLSTAIRNLLEGAAA